MRAPNLDQLRSFAVLAATGSFSAAARRLNLTQPAVSLQIRELERRFGLRLIERVGRRARPTLAGEQLLRHVNRIEAAVSEASAAIAPFKDDAVSRVVIGTGATACIYLLPAVLQNLRRRFPGMQILVRTGNSAEMLRMLEDNAIDIALVTDPVYGRMFSVTPGFTDEQVAIFPKSGMVVPKSMIPAALSAAPLLLFEPGGSTRRVVDDWFTRGGLAARPVMELGSIEAIKELVGAGLGCGIVPRISVAREKGRFIVRSLAPPLYRKLVVVLRRDKVLSRGLRHVLNGLKFDRG